jgi:hypothetical protein
MGKTQHGGKRAKRRSTYKKSMSTKPLTLLKTVAGVGKKNISTGRKIVRKKFLAGKLGIKFPKLFTGGKRRTKKRAGKIRHSKSRKHH